MFKVYYSTSSSKITVIQIEEGETYENYDVDRFFKKENGVDLSFETEREAISFLNRKFLADWVDENYLTPNNPSLFL